MPKSFIYDGEEITVGSENWKEWVLSTDPYEGDIDGGSNLQDKIVLTRNTKQLCHDCLSICKPGTYTRVISSSVDGSMVTNRFCEECCTAFAFGELHNDYKQYDYDADDYPDDEVMLHDTRLDVRKTNENILIGKLGKRYFESSTDEQFNVIQDSEAENA